MKLPSSLAGPPTLVDGEVVLRPPSADLDADTVLAGTRDPLVREFLQGVVPHRDRAAAAEWLDLVPPRLWAEGRAAYFAVALGAGPAVGWAELVDFRAETDSAEVVVWLLPAARNLRTATKALRLVCRFGFDQLALGRIDAYAAADNMPSQVMGAWIGFRRAGYRPALFRSSSSHRLHDAVHATLAPEDLC
ncbi:GNAT family N-acetyltransferase [Kitasatospora sp. NBC_01287]|uniref:GNAT family N-acetyltransferase n=1 Tax=Kitasatospora sp. NBC_01287 TaxID=2903573 RepID=UPI00225BC8A3|nr:GNAT family N-acetyltransferase [Kitasatospora sp. NBC_01287]MCX4751315.1 GNAT family N-acetyltransferase [Kitasatospora sp. NBC_01287]